MALTRPIEKIQIRRQGARIQWIIDIEKLRIAGRPPNFKSNGHFMGGLLAALIDIETALSVCAKS